MHIGTNANRMYKVRVEEIEEVSNFAIFAASSLKTAELQ